MSVCTQSLDGHVPIQDRIAPLAYIYIYMCVCFGVCIYIYICLPYKNIDGCNILCFYISICMNLEQPTVAQFSNKMP